MDSEACSICTSTFHVIIQSCICQFRLVDIVRLCASSKRLSTLCCSELASGNRLLAHQLLRKTVLQAAVAAQSATPKPTRSQRLKASKNTADPFVSPKSLQQTVKAVQWLLQVAGSKQLLLKQDSNPLAAETTAVLLQAPAAVPVDIAKALVSGGLRITYPQLFAAACSNPAGVSAWIKAHQRSHVPPGLPAYLTNICCGWSLSEDRLPPNITAPQLADAIYLAIKVAASAKQFSRISHMCRHPAAEDLEPNALALLLHAAVVKQCSFNCSSGRSSSRNLGHVSQPDQEHQQLLLGISSQSGSRQAVIPSLCSVKTAKGLTGSQLANILRVPAEAADAELISLLCTELALVAKYLSADDVSELLACIGKQHKYQTAKVAALCAPLCALQGMQQMDSGAVAALIKQMIQKQATGIVHALCGLPGAKAMPQEVVLGLVQAAREAWGASSCVLSSESGQEGGTTQFVVLQNLAEVCGCL